MQIACQQIFSILQAQRNNASKIRTAMETDEQMEIEVRWIRRDVGWRWVDERFYWFFFFFRKLFEADFNKRRMILFICLVCGWVVAFLRHGIISLCCQVLYQLTYFLLWCHWLVWSRRFALSPAMHMNLLSVCKDLNGEVLTKQLIESKPTATSQGTVTIQVKRPRIIVTSRWCPLLCFF